MKRTVLFLCLVSMLLAVSAVRAEMLDRPTGVKIGQRMTLRPYVSISATYDSNVHSRHSKPSDDVIWSISPTLTMNYKAEKWSLLASAFYNYNAYCKSENKENNRHSYGQDLRWNWSNATGQEKGWTLVLGEAFRQITMADEITLGNGKGYSADSRQLQVSAAAQRRFSEKWHADANASYYWMDYMNDTTVPNSFYGWQRWTVGAEAGFAPSPWTDFLISAGYHGYTQDNVSGANISDNSHGWTVQAGLGSFMTERISYRALAGWSRFEYGEGTTTDDGFVYTVSGNWKIGDTWNTMLLATSYYQPSERQRAARSRVDSVSWGLAKKMVRGKLRGTLDLRYRRETTEQAVAATEYDYTLDIVTGRLGLDYSLNRFLSLFAAAEYQRSWNDEGDRYNGFYDYDRWRLTGGIRLSY